MNKMWSIHVRPKETHTHTINAFVRNCYFPSMVKSMHVRFVLVCDQYEDDDCQYDCVFSPDRSIGYSSFGARDWFSFDAIKDCKELTFRLDLEIVDVEYYQNKVSANQVTDCGKIAYLLSCV